VKAVDIVSDTSRPVRVCLCVSALEVGGIDSVVHALAKGLDPQRFDVTVFSLGPDRGTGDAYRGAGVKVLAAGRDRHSGTARMAGRLFWFLLRNKIDVVHAHPGSVSRLMALLARVPVVIATYHGSWVNGADRLELTFRRRLDLRSAAVVANSRSTRDRVAADLRLPPDRVEVIYNGVDLDRFRPPSPAQRQEAREALGLLTTDVVVGTVARLFEDKGVSDVMAAIAAARNRGAPLRALIAGDGPARAELERRAASLNLVPFVHFLGSRPDIPNVLTACDLMALASRTREGFGMALAEAMAMGLPVVGTTVEGVPELVESGTNGILVRPCDPGALEDAFVRLAREERLREKLGTRARSDVLARFDVRRMVSEYGGLYDRLLASRLLRR
jgi:glycosyltransferase involved in cell wall biosynthesis